MELTLAARQAAEKLQSELYRGVLSVFLSAQKMRQRNYKSLQQWCEAQGIGEPLQGSGAWRFTQHCLQQLEEAMAHLHLRPLNQPAAATRIERSQQGNEEHKSLGEQPLEHRILCSLVSSQPFYGLAPRRRYPIYADWRELQLTAFAGLIVVENADVFFDIGASHWHLPTAFAKYCLVYRGHDVSARAVNRLKAQWHVTGKPLVYFGDGDFAGINLALQGQFTHCLLPELGEFKAHANTTQASAKQAHLAISASQVSPALAPYVAILNQQRALLQQSMQKLTLVAVPLAQFPAKTR